jgi:DNA polymerase, archaea type
LKHLGWILDLYHAHGKMIVWLKQPDGRCVRLEDKWKPRIHIGGDLRELAELACKSYVEKCRFVKRFEVAGDIERSRVLEIEVENDAEAAKLANRIHGEDRGSQFRLDDVDVPAPQVYLYQNRLFPLAYVEADANDGRVRWTLQDSREIIDYALPSFRKIKLDVKTRTTKKVRTYEDELGSLQVSKDDGEVVTIDSGCEGDKILGLVHLFKEIDPDIVITDGGDSFIFPYLARRADQNGILHELVLGREPSPLRVYEVQGHSYISYGKILYRDTAARLLGRLHIDGHNAFLSADCGLAGLFEIARTCIIPIQRASRATIGTNMTSLQLYHAVKEGVLIPWNKNQPEEWKNSAELVVADRGGLIYEPSTGVHGDVGELDFSSLYPMIMLKKNLSGETVNCKCCKDSTLRVPELGYNICQRRKGIVSSSLDILLRRRIAYKRLKKEERDEAKRLVYDQRQAALKWILVCSFGYLGFKNARFGKIDAHIATCAFSREYLQKAVAIAQSDGFRLLHGIVDSMWLTKPGAGDSDYQALAEKIEKELDLPLSYEGRYRWIVFLNSRVNPGEPVLNRYYGVFQDGTIKTRGIELRRHDTPEIVNKCQRAMITVLSEAQNHHDFLATIPKALNVLETYMSLVTAHRVPIDNLVIAKTLSKEPHEYTNMVPQAVAAKRLISEGGRVHAGQQIRYVLTRDNSSVSRHSAIPAELVDDQTVPDSESYVDLLVRSATNLFLPLGYDESMLRRCVHNSNP